MDRDLKAVVLGGTSAHIELIEKLKARGYYTILIDYYQNPIAKCVADEHIQESTLDKEKVLKIAKDKQVNLVISTSVDQANVTAVYVSEKLGLDVPYNYSTALEVSNKVLMKKIMRENGLPTSRFMIAKEINDCNDLGLKYPVIIKPSDSNGSKGVNKARNIYELRRHLDSALAISRDKQAIIEEYKTGKEIGLDCIVSNDDVTIILSRERRKIKSKNITEQQIYGSIWPAVLSNKIMNKLKNNVKQIVRAFRLNNTPIVVQAILDEDEINIIEFAPRIGGGENSRIIQNCTGFDIIDAAIDSYLGKEIEINLQSFNMYYADNLIYAQPAIFGYIDGYKPLIKTGIIEYLVELKTQGMEIGSDISSNNRVGAYVVKSETIEGLHKKIKQATSTLKVYDINGKQIMRKELY